MKRMLRSFLVNTAGFYIATIAISGIKFGGGIETLLSIGLILTLMNMFVRPLVKIFMLPFNVITLGIFSWLSGAVILFLLTLIIKELQITPFEFSGFSYSGFSIPAIHFTRIMTFVAGAAIINLVFSVVDWLCD